jgi:catechol 2,3-dioxygenase-like lactoylglutathione lyase family enzyme
MDMRIEAVVLSVSDVDRAKAFYRSLGFAEELDFADGADFRVVRFTPPGSSTGIIFGIGISSAMTGQAGGLVLSVADIEDARATLVGNGVEVSEVFHDLGGVYVHASPAWEVPGRDPSRRDRASFARFTDPDGNAWLLQEVRPDLPTGDGQRG